MLILLELALTLLTCILFWAFARRGSPFPVLPGGLRRIAAAPEYRNPFLWVVALPVADIIESNFDDALTEALGFDMTGWIHRLEGDLASHLQMDWLPAVYFFSYIYIVLLPALLAGPLILAAFEGKTAAFRSLAYGYAVNYLVGLPSYYFFPVREMWHGNGEKVSLLLDRVSPAIMETFRSTSALDNCFPSLHTSLALTVPIAAWGAWPRAVAVALWASAILIAISTIYLGIHWGIDVAAGVLLALFAGRIGLRLSRK